MPDVGREAAALINVHNQKLGLTNVQQNPGEPKALQGRNFQQFLETDYTATLQNNQGTIQLYGAWVTLFNPASHIAAFIDYNAYSPDDLQTATPDAARMIASMI
jgi:hypothetical protein